MSNLAYNIEILPNASRRDAAALLKKVFTEEQNIPEDLHFPSSKNQLWWCVKRDGNIVGTAAVWKVGARWHWGRLALAEELRGKGLGKKLVLHSLEESFGYGIEGLKIDAREITVAMLEKMGGKITGNTTDFYGIPITPMLLQKANFKTTA